MTGGGRPCRGAGLGLGAAEVDVPFVLQFREYIYIFL